jgi:hypothetical protein
MRRLLAAALLCVAAPAALPAYSAEPDLLERIGAQIGQHAVVRAEFTQTRQMAAMKRPLATSGRLVYARQQGVLWQIEQPYRIGYVLGEERIAEIAADGTRRERRVRDVPGLAQVSRVLRALFGAEAAVLREHFEVTQRGDVTKWELELKPRQPQLAQFLSVAGVRRALRRNDPHGRSGRRRHADPLPQLAGGRRARRRGTAALRPR